MLRFFSVIERVGLNPKISASIYPSPGVGQGLGSEWYHNKKLPFYICVAHDRIIKNRSFRGKLYFSFIDDDESQFDGGKLL